MGIELDLIALNFHGPRRATQNASAGRMQPRAAGWTALLTAFDHLKTITLESIMFGDVMTPLNWCHGTTSAIFVCKLKEPDSNADVLFKLIIMQKD